MTRARKFVVFIASAIAGCATVPVDEPGFPETRHSAATRVPVIAHRGASGYLPEHTLAAKAMAYAQGADYIEQDLVMTRDDALVVLHDIHLDSVTNVRDVFPGRAREDGRFYVIDFTLDEIRQLAVAERFDWKQGMQAPIFADRYPPGPSPFGVNTFAEEIELIQGLNASTGKAVGIYPELKNPAYHRQHGKDIATVALLVLRSYGYTRAADPVYLQCFDAGELRRIHDELMPRLGMSVRLVQLAEPTEENLRLLSRDGLAAIATYAAGIGPSMHLLVDPESSPGNLRISDIVKNAHAAGLQVHPFTFRRESGQIPPYARDFNELLHIFLIDVGVDGVFTDFPDLTVQFIRSMQQGSDSN